MRLPVWLVIWAWESWSCFYDDNQVQIDGPTGLAFTEKVDLRFEAYGWHVQHIDDGDADLEGIVRAVEAAKAVTDKPSYIRIRTTIGYGSKWAGTERVHGAPLGPEEAKAAKAKLGLDPERRSFVPEKVYEVYRKAARTFSKEAFSFPQQERRFKGLLPENLCLPTYKASDPPVVTRKVSETFNSGTGTSHARTDWRIGRLDGLQLDTLEGGGRFSARLSTWTLLALWCS